MLCLLAGLQAMPAPIWELSDAIAISGVSRGGRVPFPQDDLLPHITSHGSATVFHAGETIAGRNDSVHKWVAVKADSKGALNQPQAGYVQAIVHSDSERSAVLKVNGAGMLYWNGAPRPGDVYGYGYVSLPVQLHAGDNTLLVASGRGSLTARLEAPKAAQQLNLADPTLPDVLTTDKGTLLGAVVVLNNTDSVADHLRLRAGVGNQSVESQLPPVAPFSLRKVPFRIPVVGDKAGTTEHVSLTLSGSEGDEDAGSVDVSVVGPLTTHKRTFISGIDGSLQYYGVVPAQKPSKSNALVLTLHGASVEAIGQARAYKAKDWCTIVAATNRRPYGFDWEDIGRLDALEVLDIAKKAYPHDPARVVLTGHSMGGHGTWSVGTMYPNLFAAIAPSAGWVSFQSYAGGFKPSQPDPVEQLFLAAAAPSDTLGRVRNTLEEKTFILHGDADDNVPVTEARTMKQALTDIGADFVYHEQPGAGHWWGNECVDWPPLFETLEKARLKDADDPAPIDFTTPNPQVSSTLRWITVLEQQHAGLSSVQAKLSSDGASVDVDTKNVGRLVIRAPKGSNVSEVHIDGVTVEASRFPLEVVHSPLQGLGSAPSPSWSPAHSLVSAAMKNPARYGGFKQAFQRNMLFVVGTNGSEANRLWGFARYLAESMYYRGNGAIDIVTDADYLKQRHQRAYRDRNVVLFGNADDNAAWKILLADCPLKVTNGSASFGGLASGVPGYSGSDGAVLVTYPLLGSTSGLVAGFGITGPDAIDALERLPILPSGAAYPDWVVFQAGVEPTTGTKSVVVAGNFGPTWTLAGAETVRR